MRSEHILMIKDDNFQILSKPAYLSGDHSSLGRFPFRISEAEFPYKLDALPVCE